MLTDSLIELYRSLDKQEKRWLSVMLQNREEAGDFIPARLFSGLSQTNDPEQLRQIFSGTKQEPQFAVIKTQLYNRMLFLLLAYSRTGLPDRVLSDDLAMLQVLFNKKLYGQCARMYTRVRRRTGYVHRPALLAELDAWELRLLHARQDVKALEKRSREIYRLQEKHLKAQAQIYLLQRLTYEVYTGLKSGWFLSQNKMQETGNELLAIREKDLLSDHGRVLYYQVWSTLLFSRNEAGKAILYLQKLIRFLHESPAVRNVFEVHYISALNNANLLYLQQKKYSAILGNIRLLRQVEPRTVSRRQQLHERLLTIEMNVYLETNDLQSASALVPEMEKLLQNNRTDPVYRKLFLLLIFRFEFGNRRLRAALRTLARLRQEEKSQVRPDIHRAVSVLEMIVHAESGHSDFVATLAKRLSRKKTAGPDAVQKAFAVYLEKWQTIHTAKEKKALGLALEKELLSAAHKSLFTENYQANFDFLGWIRGKAGL